MTASSGFTGRPLARRAQRASPPAPQRARVRGMAAINATGTSNTDSSVSLDVRPFPAHPDPGRYYVTSARLLPGQPAPCDAGRRRGGNDSTTDTKADLPG